MHIQVIVIEPSGKAIRSDKTIEAAAVPRQGDVILLHDLAETFVDESQTAVVIEIEWAYRADQLAPRIYCRIQRENVSPPPGRRQELMDAGWL